LEIKEHLLLFSLSFFLEYTGELRIIALREEKTDLYKKPPPTPARAMGVLIYNKA
jgi:hypothetical protein